MLILLIFAHSRPPKQPESVLPPNIPTLTSSFVFPDHIGGYRLVHSTFSNVESRFGIVFPKLGPRPITTAAEGTE